MKNILAQANRRIIEQFVMSKVAVVFDYDGTLAPIVPDPALAAMRTRTRTLLGRVAEAFPAAVISGRAHKDVAALLEGTGVRYIVGNHGADWGWASLEGVKIEQRVAAWGAALRPRLSGLTGVMLEDKTYSLAIHFRQSREKRRVQSLIAAALRDLRGARVTLGKAVVNVVADGAPHKGVALKRVRALLACDTAIYVGDDTNDEDVFALDEPGQLLAVRVGAVRDTLATYCLKDQSEIDPFLRALLEARARPARRA